MPHSLRHVFKISYLGARLPRGATKSFRLIFPDLPPILNIGQQEKEGIRFHLLHDLSTVCLYCDFADAEFSADLLVQQTGDYQCYDLPFSRSD